MERTQVKYPSFLLILTYCDMLKLDQLFTKYVERDFTAFSINQSMCQICSPQMQFSNQLQPQ